MNVKKSSLRKMLCCASLSLLTAPLSAVAENQDSSVLSSSNDIKLASKKTSTSPSIDLQALLGDDHQKVNAVTDGQIIPNQYIVTYSQEHVENIAQELAGGSLSALSDKEVADFQAQAVATLTSEIASTYEMKIASKFAYALHGFSANIDNKTLTTFIKDPRVKSIEQDQIMEASVIQNNATWGLDRIDEANLPLDGFYEYIFDGSGVDAYIIDTGIRASHNQFGGRVRSGFDAIRDGRGSNDCNGHGTHVAGTVGAQTYGVAKNVNLIPVRVLSCTGSGSNSGVIEGVDYVAQVASGPSVANMSLGGGNSPALDQAVENAIDDGITFVLAAGNDNANACFGSPSRVGPALTIGATTSSDSRSSFSNFGSCVDMFAPGSQITSAWFNSNNATNTISGTSMAAPHVAGVVALYLDQSPSASPAQVGNALESAAVSGRLSGIGNGSPNGGGGACAFEDDFSSSTGWQISADSTCSTGTYVRGNPTQTSAGGLVTQVGGDAGGDGFAVYTATNTSAGADDVDGGVCIAQSPTIAVSDASTLSLDWFHGQRDGGDDSGDFFGIEYSLNGGSTFNSLVGIGDTRTQAQWSNASTAIPAGSNVVVRIRTSDGAGPGDIIEGGIDSVEICSN